MGWCSATEIMDWAIQMADDAVAEVVAEPITDDMRRQIDDRIRPLVGALATKLHNEDWDCEQDSRYFDRFRQEMLGCDDREFATWLADNIDWASDGDEYEKVAELQRDLNAVRQRIQEAG